MSSGKNLLKLTEGTITYNGITITVSADGFITINGTVTSGYLWFKLTNGLEAHSVSPTLANKPNWFNNSIYSGVQTFSISDYSATLSTYNIAYGLLSTDGVINTTTVTTQSKTIDKATSDLVLYVGATGVIHTNVKFHIQNERGTISTPYEPFRGMQTINFPYTLRSLPDGTKDYIIEDSVAKTKTLYQNIGERTIISGDVTLLDTSGINNDLIKELISRQTIYIIMFMLVMSKKHLLLKLAIFATVRTQ